jgi:paraquat-inducible protein B
VAIDIFVETPHHLLVHDDTRFWNASGINLSLSATGFEVSTESLLSIMAGGVAFETLPSAGGSEVAVAGTAFPLHDSRSDAEEAQITQRNPYLVYFDGSVRGLSVGAPVEFRGIRIGSVADVRMVIDEKDETVSIPVLIQLEPQRITIDNPLFDQTDRYAAMADLVVRGLRAQLQLGNLLTGELYVALDFHPDAEPAILNMDGRFPELPTIPTDLEAIAKSINNVLKGIAALPLAELVGDMSDTAKSLKALVSSDEITGMIAALSRSASSFDDVMASVDKDIGPLLSDLRGAASAADDAMVAARSTMTSTEQMVGEKSTMRYDLNKLITELTAAARSIRVFADYLERHPDSLIRGKGGSSR